MPVKKNAALGFIFVTLLIDVIGFGIIIPVMPQLFGEMLNMKPENTAEYGVALLAVFGVMQFVCSPLMGNLSDRYGRRPVLLASLFGFGIDYLLLAIAPNIWWLFLGRIVAGALGASFTTASAYIADISAPEDRAKNFGMIGAAFGLGFVIGPALGGLLGDFGPRVPFMAAAVLTLLNWLYGYFVLPESLSPEHRRTFEWKRANPVGVLQFFLRYKVILGLVGSIVLIYVAAHAVQSTWSYYTIAKFNWGPKAIGISLAVVGVLVALVQGLLIRLIMPKLGQARSIYVGLFMYAVGFFLFAFATEGWMMYVFLIPYCLGGIAGPALQGIMSSQVSPKEQGELQGALTSLMSITTIIGPLMMGFIFHEFNDSSKTYYFPGAAMVTGGVLTLLSAFLARLNLKKTADQHTPASPAAPIGH